MPRSEYKAQVPTTPVTSTISPMSATRYDLGVATQRRAKAAMRTIPSMILITRSIMPTFFSPIFKVFTYMVMGTGRNK
jgi:hypothetical protein